MTTLKIPSGLPASWPPDVGLNNGSPWWAKFAAYFGIPALFAAFLIWFVTTIVSTTLAGMSKKLDEHITISGFYLRQVCVNTAKDDSQRALCSPPAEMR